MTKIVLLVSNIEKTSRHTENGSIINRSTCHTLSYCVNDNLRRELKVIPRLSTHGICLASGSSRFIFSQTSGRKLVLQKGKKAKGNKDMRMACVKCYNYGNKGLYTRDCPELIKVPSFTVAPE